MRRPRVERALRQKAWQRTGGRAATYTHVCFGKLRRPSTLPLTQAGPAGHMAERGRHSDAAALLAAAKKEARLLVARLEVATKMSQKEGEERLLAAIDNAAAAAVEFGMRKQDALAVETESAEPAPQAMEAPLASLDANTAEPPSRDAAAGKRYSPGSPGADDWVKVGAGESRAQKAAAWAASQENLADIRDALHAAQQVARAARLAEQEAIDADAQLRGWFPSTFTSLKS